MWNVTSYKSWIICLGVLFFAMDVQGHPLGNFSLNHYNVIELQPAGIVTQHVLDFAEIPSYNELSNVDLDGDDLVSDEELEQYKQSVRKRFLPDLQFGLRTAKGDSVALEEDSVEIDVILANGEGGLTCVQVRIIQEFRVDLQGEYRFSLWDQVLKHIRGLKEIRIRTYEGVSLDESGVQLRDGTSPLALSEDTWIMNGLEVMVPFAVDATAEQNELKRSEIIEMMNPGSIPQFPLMKNEDGAYEILKSPVQPNREVQEKISMLQPRNVMNATGMMSRESKNPEAATAAEETGMGTSSGIEKESSGWTNFIREEDLSPSFVMLAFLASILFGASHALSPGHGKTVVAAYLVGSRGTVWHAVFLGMIVTLTHVSSVLLLGVITLFFSQYILPDQLYPYIEGGSGLLILAIGASLFLRRYGAYQRMKFAEQIGIASEHAHAHHHHPHSHEHKHQEHGHSHHSHEHLGDHEHGPHTHTHEIPADANWKDLLILGITGGIVPCPTAIVVLLVAISMHRILFGLTLIIFFSIGLAAVLIAIGILMVTAKKFMNRFSGTEKSLAWLQIASPVVIMLLGVVIFIRGLASGGVISIQF